MISPSDNRPGHQHDCRALGSRASIMLLTAWFLVTNLIFYSRLAERYADRVWLVLHHAVERLR